MRRERGVTNEIRALKRLKWSQIDTTDIPETLDWSKAIGGKFYRPMSSRG